MNTHPNHQTTAKKLPPRTVTEREKRFPALSITYRIFAQMEIMCMVDGADVDEYCKMFKRDDGSQSEYLVKVHQMLYNGSADGTANRHQCEMLVYYILKECTAGSMKANTPNPKKRFPSLTWLYHHYVIHGNDTAADVGRLKETLVDELYNSHLIW